MGGAPAEEGESRGHLRPEGSATEGFKGEEAAGFAGCELCEVERRKEADYGGGGGAAQGVG